MRARLVAVYIADTVGCQVNLTVLLIGELELPFIKANIVLHEEENLIWQV